MPRTTNRLWIGIIVLLIGICYLTYVDKQIEKLVVIGGIVAFMVWGMVSDVKRWIANRRCPECKNKVEDFETHCPYCKTRLKEEAKQREKDSEED
jgi:hypothetical protein